MTLPPSAASRPARSRSKVVLPTPLGPTTPRRVRGPTVRSILSSTVAPPNARASERATSENEEAGMARSHREAETAGWDRNYTTARVPAEPVGRRAYPRS